MDKNDKAINTKIGPYLKSNIGNEVKLLSEVSSEIIF